MTSQHDTTAFLREARRNLAMVRRLFGAHSTRYRRVASQYREVASALGCRRELERMLHHLSRRYRACGPGMPPQHPWPDVA